MSVRTVQLEDVCDITDGTHYTPPNIGGPFPFLTVKDMTEDGLAFQDCSYVAEVEFVKARNAGACPSAGDVLFSKDGTVGKVHVVSSEKPFAVLSSIAILRPDPSRVDSDFLGYALRNRAILGDAISRKTGSALQRIILGDLKKVSIPLPDLRQQKRIARLLEEAERLRRIRRCALELSDALIPAVFLEIFGDPSSNPHGFPSVRVDELFEGDRDGTKCGPFGTALKKHEYVSQGIPVWTMENFSDGDFQEDGCLYITDEKYRELTAYSVTNGDILISRAGTVGRMAIVRTKHDHSIIHTNLIRLSLDAKRVLPVFFVTLMKSFAPRISRLKRGQEDAYTFMNTGSLGELRIPLPPMALQQHFAELLIRYEHLRATQREALRQADHIFQSLLHRSFS